MKRKPLKVLFVGDRSNELLIREELKDESYGEEVVAASSVSRALELLLDAEAGFNLVLVMNYTSEIESAQEVIEASRRNCPTAVIIQIGTFSPRKEAFICPPDEVWEASSDIGGLMKIIRRYFK